VTVPISLWPPSDFDAAVLVLRAAKFTIDTDVMLTPVPALPGGPGPILCFGSLPDFVADCILISEDGINDVVRVSAALQHWLNGGVPTYTVGDMLSRFAGIRIREITDPFELAEVEYNLEMHRARLA